MPLPVSLQPAKDRVLAGLARGLMTCLPGAAGALLRRGDRLAALVPYLRVEVCARFFGPPARRTRRFSIEHTRDLWWGEASSDFGLLKSQPDFDFGRTAYAPLWQHLVTEVLPTIPDGGRVLEYGCSTGQWLFALARRVPRLRYEGYDFNAQAIEQARRLAGGDARFAFHVAEDALGGPFDLAIICATLYWNGVDEVRRILDVLALRARRLVFLEPLEMYRIEGQPRPSTRMLSQPALNHNYLQLLADAGFRVVAHAAHPTAFKTLPAHARLIRRVFPQARVLPGKRPDRVMVDGIVDYAVVDGESKRIL